MPKPTRAGPTLSDVIHAKEIAEVLKKKPRLRKWVLLKFRSTQGRRDLLAMLHVEGVDC